MIPNQWYVALDSREVGSRPLGVRRMGEPLVLWRDSRGEVACIADVCVHRRARLSLGETAGDRLRCPFHGLEYDASGRCRLIPANGAAAAVPQRFRVPGYPTHEEAGFIWIYWGKGGQPTDLPRFFEDIDPGMRWASYAETWAVHYSRAVENQLDVAHLPFVHRTTIGRGNRKVVDGPVVRWTGENSFQVFVFNRLDDGTTARRPEDLPLDPEPEFHLEFRLPNLWQNHISRQVRVVAAFAPVDDGHTRIYLRFYQSFLRGRLLGGLVTRLAMPYNRKILHQDRRVVLTQEPRKSELHGGEQLIQADLPITAFRSRRAELISRAAE
jgi:phenylpropionate dioxygenase-like ring-hydroxylating dioxygenase large terminal subunit